MERNIKNEEWCISQAFNRKIEATRYFDEILKPISTFNTGATGLNNG